MAKMSSIRWAFNFGSWQPTRQQWLTAVQAIQPEEKERIGKFVFKKDAKSSMIGRLLLRKAIHESLHIPWAEINLDRSNKGKPYLVNNTPLTPEFSFNVSHQGDFTVIAAETNLQVGVDVMKIEETVGNKSTEDFFQLMERQFTEQEWKCIKQSENEKHQLATFYRFWCLKESYVKALGVGITISLQKIDFHIKSPLVLGEYVSDTKVYVEGEYQSDWKFEETLLNSNHCVATALCKKKDSELPSQESRFSILSIEEILTPAHPLTPPDEQHWVNFHNKKERPGVRCY